MQTVILEEACTYYNLKIIIKIFLNLKNYIRMSADTTIYIRKEEHIDLFFGLVEKYSMYYYVFVDGKLVLVQRGEEDDEPPLKPIME